MEEKRLFISYYLNKQRENKLGICTLYMRLTVAGQRENINTGVLVDEKLWDRAKSKIKGKSASVSAHNNLITSLRSKALTIYTELLNADVLVTATIIKNKLVGNDESRVTLMEALDMHNKQIKKRVGAGKAKATLVKYETLKVKIEKCLKQEYKKSDILLRELSYAFILNFEVFLKSEGIKHNTTVKYIQFFKKIIHYSIANEWLQHDPFKQYKCSFQPVIRECLNNDEIKALIDKSFDTGRLNQVRDIFIFCCYTGLSYADVKKLKTDEIVKGIDDNLWIQTVREKTNIRVPVPLLPEALSIMEKYGQWRESKQSYFILPVLSNQKMNAYLKEIADLCKIKKKLTFHI